MKVKPSPYIQSVRPLLKELLAELEKSYPYASILAADSREKSYSVNRRLSSISGSGMMSARGFVVKVFDGKHWSEHSFNEITEEKIPDILAQIRETAAMSAAAMPAGIMENEYTAPEEEETVFSDSTSCQNDPEELGDDVILEKMKAVRDRGLAVNGQILDCVVRINWNRTSKLFLSPKKDLEQTVLWTTGMAGTIAAKGQEIKSSFRSVSALGGMELLDQLGADVEDAAKTTIELLDSLPMVAGEYDCVCSPEVTGMIVHEAFGHGVEMDMFVKKRAQAEKFIGQYVASPLVTMHDGAAAYEQTGSYFFDDEGTMAHDTVVIDKGVLKTGISDYQSARILGTEPTGNGRHGGSKELGHPVHGQHRQGDQRRQAYRQNLLANRADRLCTGSSEIHQHDVAVAGTVRKRILRQRLQGVGQGVRRRSLYEGADPAGMMNERIRSARFCEKCDITV